jgi:hypothetical protein
MMRTYAPPPPNECLEQKRKIRCDGSRCEFGTDWELFCEKIQKDARTAKALGEFGSVSSYRLVREILSSIPSSFSARNVNI